MPFQINASAPAAGNGPRSPAVGGSSEKFVLPEPTGIDGQGTPVGAVGYPSYELFFDKLSATGFAWYAAFVGTATHADLTSLQVWNPYASGGSGAWTTYSTTAIMHRPTYERRVEGGLFYEGVRILFTELS